MKQKHTQARKARRYCQRIKGLHELPVIERRKMNIRGADWREYDAKHPTLYCGGRSITCNPRACAGFASSTPPSPACISPYPTAYPSAALPRTSFSLKD